MENFHVPKRHSGSARRASEVQKQKGFGEHAVSGAKGALPLAQRTVADVVGKPVELIRRTLSSVPTSKISVGHAFKKGKLGDHFGAHMRELSKHTSGRSSGTLKDFHVAQLYQYGDQEGGFLDMRNAVEAYQKDLEAFVSFLEKAVKEDAALGGGKSKALQKALEGYKEELRGVAIWLRSADDAVAFQIFEKVDSKAIFSNITVGDYLKQIGPKHPHYKVLKGVDSGEKLSNLSSEIKTEINKRAFDRVDLMRAMDGGALSALAEKCGLDALLSDRLKGTASAPRLEDKPLALSVSGNAFKGLKMGTIKIRGKSLDIGKHPERVRGWLQAIGRGKIRPQDIDEAMHAIYRSAPGKKGYEDQVALRRAINKHERALVKNIRELERLQKKGKEKRLGGVRSIGLNRAIAGLEAELRGVQLLRAGQDNLGALSICNLDKRQTAMKNVTLEQVINSRRGVNGLRNTPLNRLLVDGREQLSKKLDREPTLLDLYETGTLLPIYALECLPPDVALELKEKKPKAAALISPGFWPKSSPSVVTIPPQMDSVSADHVTGDRLKEITVGAYLDVIGENHPHYKDLSDFAREKPLSAPIGVYGYEVKRTDFEAAKELQASQKDSTTTTTVKKEEAGGLPGSTVTDLDESGGLSVSVPESDKKPPVTTEAKKKEKVDSSGKEGGGITDDLLAEGLGLDALFVQGDEEDVHDKKDVVGAQHPDSIVTDPVDERDLSVQVPEPKKKPPVTTPPVTTEAEKEVGGITDDLLDEGLGLDELFGPPDLSDTIEADLDVVADKYGVDKTKVTDEKNETVELGVPGDALEHIIEVSDPIIVPKPPSTDVEGNKKVEEKKDVVEAPVGEKVALPLLSEMHKVKAEAVVTYLQKSGEYPNVGAEDLKPIAAAYVQSENMKTALSGPEGSGAHASTALKAIEKGGDPEAVLDTFMDDAEAVFESANEAAIIAGFGPGMAEIMGELSDEDKEMLGNAFMLEYLPAAELEDFASASDDLYQIYLKEDVSKSEVVEALTRFQSASQALVEETTSQAQAWVTKASTIETVVVDGGNQTPGSTPPPTGSPPPAPPPPPPAPPPPPPTAPPTPVATRDSTTTTSSNTQEGSGNTGGGDSSSELLKAIRTGSSRSKLKKVDLKEVEEEKEAFKEEEGEGLENTLKRTIRGRFARVFDQSEEDEEDNEGWSDEEDDEWGGSGW